jgi:hypothetical protein
VASIPFLAVLLGLCFASLASAAEQPHKLRMAFTSLSGSMAPPWIAREGGYFAKQGLEVEVIAMPSGVEGMNALLAGEVQFLHIAGGTTVSAAVGGGDVIILATTINTPDNIRTIVGNNKILGDTIQNFSANPHRRVDLVAQLHHTVDPEGAIKRLRERLGRIPNVVTNPAPQVEILQFTAAGPLLAVRPSCRNEDYWQVYFDTNRAIGETFAGAGYPAPEQLVVVRNAT